MLVVVNNVLVHMNFLCQHSTEHLKFVPGTILCHCFVVGMRLYDSECVLAWETGKLVFKGKIGLVLFKPR